MRLHQVHHLIVYLNIPCTHLLIRLWQFYQIYDHKVILTAKLLLFLQIIKDCYLPYQYSGVMVALFCIRYFSIQLVPLKVQRHSFGSDTPCVRSGFLHHRMNTFAHRLPVFFSASLLHLHLYFTEILSVLTAQCRYCPTFIHNYTGLIRCKDTTFIFISSNFCLFSLVFLIQLFIRL